MHFCALRSSKFVENEFEKCDRLVELIVAYSEKDKKALRAIAESQDGDMDAEERQMAR